MAQWLTCICNCIADADLVLETCEDHDITLEGEALNIQLYVEDSGGNIRRHNERFSVVAGSNEDDVEEEEDDDDEEDNRTIEVSGFAQSTSRDNLYYYFSNQRKGGGDIEGDITVDKEENKAQIVFKDKKGNTCTCIETGSKINSCLLNKS